MKKRWLSLLVSLLLLFPMVIPAAVSVSAAGATVNINNYGDFKNFIKNIDDGKDYNGDTVSLNTDITLTETVRTTKGCFRGTFRGNGHTIALTNSTNSNFLSGSLINYAENAVFEDLVLTGKAEEGEFTSHGALVRTAQNTTFRNIVNKAAVWGRKPVFAWPGGAGGIVGTASACRFEDCVNHGTVGNVTAMVGVGGIAGFAQADTRFYRCKNDGTIMNGNDGMASGGIVGLAYSVHIVDCENAGKVTVKVGVAGGIVGCLFGGDLSCCKNSGNISGRGGLGGIAGQAVDGESIRRVENTGDVSGTGEYIGGIAGLVEWQNVRVPYIEIAVNRGSVTGGDEVGGICGHLSSGWKGYISAAVNYGTVSCTQDDGRSAGIAALAYGSIDNCANHGIVKGKVSAGIVVEKGEIQIKNCVSDGAVASRYKGVYKEDNTADGPIYCDPTSNSRMINILNGNIVSAGTPVWGVDPEGHLAPTLTHGFGSEAHPFELSSANELQHLAYGINESRGVVTDNGDGLKYFVLTDDIYDTKGVAEPIGKRNGGMFAGVFDGKGHTVFLKMNKPDSNNVGLFGVTDHAIIKDLRVAGGVQGKENVGGIVGMSFSNTLIFNCQNDASVTAKNYAGGIAGIDEGLPSLFANCLNRGDITATDGYAGGICAYALEGWGGVVMERCVNAGNVAGKKPDSAADTTGYSDAIGCGIFGNSMVIFDCYNVPEYCNATTTISGAESLSSASDLKEIFKGRSLGFATKYLLSIYSMPEPTLSDAPGLASIYLKEGAFSSEPMEDFEDEVVGIWLPEFLPEYELKLMPDVYYPELEPTVDAPGHLEYYYSFLTGKYYSDYKLTSPITNISKWLKGPTGKGYLAKLNRADCYVIDGKLFSTRSKAEAYIEEHYSDGISQISLAGDLETKYAIGIKTSLTVDLNGHTWTYSGTDEKRAIFYAKEDRVTLVINGNTEAVRNEQKETLDTAGVNVYVAKNNDDMGTIRVNANRTARLLAPGDNKYTNITLRYARISGTNATNEGGGLVNPQGEFHLEMDCAIVEKSFAATAGGAVYINAVESAYTPLVEIKMTHSAFVECTASYKAGGAICINANDSTSFKLTGDGDSGFWDCCSRRSGGGAVALLGAQTAPTTKISGLYFCECYCGEMLSIEMLTLDYNSSLSGGAIYSEVKNPSITDCDFSTCLAGGCGGAICLRGDYDANLAKAATTANPNTNTARVLSSLRIKDCNAVSYGKDIFFDAYSGVIENISLQCDTSASAIGTDYDDRIFLAHDVKNSTGTGCIKVTNVSIDGGTLTGSILSTGTLWVVIGVILAGIAAVVGIVVYQKKKKPVTAASASESDE